MEAAIYSAALLDPGGRFTVERFRQSFHESLKIWGPPRPTSDSFPDLLRDVPPRTSLNSESVSVTDNATKTSAHSLPKLKLVLDLDNTLLQAYPREKLKGCNIHLDDFVDHEGNPEMYKFILPKMKNQLYYVKFRPGVRQFLSELHEFCDFAIHTNAMREYADVMLSILDPDRKYFGQRVAARYSNSMKDWKKDLDALFDACSSAHSDGRDLLIVDDRKDVWSEALQANLIQCTFYEYFESRKEALFQKYGLDGVISAPGGENVPETAVPKSDTSETDVSTTAESEVASEDDVNDFPMESDAVIAAAVAAAEQGSSIITEFGSENYEDVSALVDCLSVWNGEHTEEPTDASRGDGEDSGNNEELTDSEIVGAVDYTVVEKKSENSTDVAASEPSETTQGETDAVSSTERDGDTVASQMEKAAGTNDSQNTACALFDEPDRQLFFLRDLLIRVVEDYRKQLREENSGSHPPLSDDPRPKATRVKAANILAESKRSILNGVVALMTGFNKTESPSDHGMLDSGPIHKRRLVALGASVVNKPSDKVTHVVALRNTATTDLMRMQVTTGVRSNVAICHPLWLAACESCWTNVDVGLFGADVLIRKYQERPPIRPLIEHWSYTRSLIPLPMLGPPPSSSDGGAAASGVEPGTGSAGHEFRSETNMQQDDSASGRSGLNSSDNATKPTRFWLATGTWSDGAEVWSPQCHTVIRFHPVKSSRLVQQLRQTQVQHQQPYGGASISDSNGPSWGNDVPMSNSKEVHSSYMRSDDNSSNGDWGNHNFYNSSQHQNSYEGGFSSYETAGGPSGGALRRREWSQQTAGVNGGASNGGSRGRGSRGGGVDVKRLRLNQW